MCMPALFQHTKSPLPFQKSFPTYQWTNLSASSDPKWKSNSRAARSLFVFRGVTGISEVQNKHCPYQDSSVPGAGPRGNVLLTLSLYWPLVADHWTVRWSLPQALAILNFPISPLHSEISMRTSVLQQLLFHLNDKSFFDLAQSNYYIWWGAVWGVREAGWKHEWRVTSQRLL